MHTVSRRPARRALAIQKSGKSQSICVSGKRGKRKLRNDLLEPRERSGVASSRQFAGFRLEAPRANAALGNGQSGLGLSDICLPGTAVAGFAAANAARGGVVCDGSGLRFLRRGYRFGLLLDLLAARDQWEANFDL